MVASLVQDIFKVLAQTEGCLEPLESRLIPTVSSILDAPMSTQREANDDPTTSVSPGLKAVALDILQTVVRSAAFAKGEPNSLSQIMMTRAFPAALNVTMNTDDNAVMQVDLICSDLFFLNT